MDILESARKHGVQDTDMLHAVTHFWQELNTDDPSTTVYIGPSRSAAPLEVVVLQDESGTAIIHAMEARRKYLERLVDL